MNEQKLLHKDKLTYSEYMRMYACRELLKNEKHIAVFFEIFENLDKQYRTKNIAKLKKDLELVKYTNETNRCIL